MHRRPSCRIRRPTEIDAAVARRIAAEIEDGDCLQIGIGGMPNAVCTLLLESGVRDLGVHTEMMTDGLAELYKAGRITGARKTLNPGKIVYTFALGSRDLYATLDRNRDMHCCPGRLHQRAAHHHAERPRDLDQQHHADRLAGTGGLRVRRSPPHQRHGRATAVRARRLRLEGRQVVHLPVVDLREARRAPQPHRAEPDPGNVVTTPRSDVMFVVTEYGIVNLKGKSVAERAKALIGIAHPDFREGLERQAYEHRLIPRGVSF